MAKTPLRDQNYRGIIPTFTLNAKSGTGHKISTSLCKTNYKVYNKYWGVGFSLTYKLTSWPVLIPWMPAVQ